MNDPSGPREETWLPPGPYRLQPGFMRRAPLAGWVLLGLSFGSFAVAAWLLGFRAWAVRGSAALWVLAGGMMLAGGVVFWRLGSMWFRKRRLARALSESGHEAAVRILGVEQQFLKSGAVLRFKLGVPTRDGERKVIEVFHPGQGGPFVLPDGRGLALVSPLVPGECILLRHDLWPLVLGDAVRAQVIDRAERERSA